MAVTRPASPQKAFMLINQTGRGGNLAREAGHHWNAVRALLMLLGIPYHAAMAYRAGHEWIVQSGEGAPIFTYLAQVIHLFRMPAFFVIAGFFSAMILARRSPAEWLRQRFMRLGIPLVASLVTLVPLLNLACELSNLPRSEALVSWQHNSATSGGYWVRHLWFLIVLLYLCTAAAVLARRFPGLRAGSLPPAVDGWLARRFLAMTCSAAVAIGLWEAVSIELFYMAGAATNLFQQILRLDELLAFAPYFVLGCILARAPQVRERLYRFSPAILLAAILSLGLDLVFLDAMPPPLARLVETIAALSLTQLLIALARRFADRPFPAVERLVSASFVIYLFHLPVIVILVDIGQAVAMPLVVKVPLVMVLTLLLSWGAWRIISSSPLLRLIFDGTGKLALTPANRRASVARA
jgi:glucan biosynthesis protein C